MSTQQKEGKGLGANGYMRLCVTLVVRADTCVQSYFRLHVGKFEGCETRLEGFQEGQVVQNRQR